MINKKRLVAYWHSSGHNAIAIQAKLVSRFREKTVAYSSVTKWLRRLHFGREIFEPGIYSEKPLDGPVDIKILTELTILPFHSVQTLVSRLEIPRSTM
jgi:hypothetical protein